MVGRSGRQENGQNEWCDVECQGPRAKAPPCPDRTLQTPLPQQNSSSTREEEDHWVLMEDRRRRIVAFENLAKEMLRYLDNSDDVKVGISELQERVEVPLQFGTSIQQVAQQARSESGQKIFEVFWQEEELRMVRWTDVNREIQMLNKRQEIFPNAIEGKLRVQDRASERLQDQLIEEIKELEHTKTEEALHSVRKEHDLWMYQNEREEANRLHGVRKPRKDEENGLGATKKHIKMARLGRGDKEGRKRVEAGA